MEEFVTGTGLSHDPKAEEAEFDKRWRIIGNKTFSNKKEIIEALGELMPNSRVYAAPHPTFYVDTEDGHVVTDECWEFKKAVSVQSYRFKTVYDLLNVNWGRVYFYEVESAELSGKDLINVTLRLAVLPPLKKKITLSIETEVYDKFSVIADRLAINKSKFVENFLKEFITKNSQ